ncbi:MAG: hypothetical protein EA401_11165 [Planctomycetota bacterium]|nr:MAG: hypothetical protein EA401_11165 [Planctomycetota bacterium]
MSVSDSPPPGFTRIAILLERPATPGELAKACNCDADALGLISIEHNQAIVDVLSDQSLEARKGLELFGATQFHSRSTTPVHWTWLRLAVGRNHGLTLSHLRKLMDRSGASKLGRIHVNNSHSLIGVREDEFTNICQHFSDQRVNGVALRPGPAQPGEAKDSPEYRPGRP